MAASAQTAVFLWLFVFSGCGEHGSEKKGWKMADISFTLPPGAIDKTPYLFTSANTPGSIPEEVKFSRDALPDGVRTLDALVSYRLDQLRGVTRGEVKILEDAPARFLSVNARRLDIQQEAGGHSERTLALLAVLPDNSYAQLTYSQSRNFEEASRDLDHMAASVQPAGAQTGPATVGFTRRSAGAVTLEMPSRLHPPSRYLFDLPGASEPLQVTVWRVGDPDPIGPLSSAMKSDASRAEQMGPSQSRGIQIGPATGELLRYSYATKRYDELQHFTVWRARISFADGAVAAAFLRLPGPPVSEVDDQFAAFVGGVHQQ